MPLLILFLFLAFAERPQAQNENQNLKQPALNAVQLEQLHHSRSDRIRFEVELMDSLLSWTNSVECSYRIAGFFSSCNDQLLLNRAWLLENRFDGSLSKLKNHLNERLLEILTDFSLEQLYVNKASQWDDWINQFIRWIPKKPKHDPELVRWTTLSNNLVKVFSYYGISNRH